MLLLSNFHNWGRLRAWKYFRPLGVFLVGGLLSHGHRLKHGCFYVCYMCDLSKIFVLCKWRKIVENMIILLLQSRLITIYLPISFSSIFLKFDIFIQTIPVYRVTSNLFIIGAIIPSHVFAHNEFNMPGYNWGCIFFVCLKERSCLTSNPSKL